MLSLAKRVTTVYKDLFNEDISLKFTPIDVMVYNKFLDEYKGEGSRIIFKKENRWRVVWAILGELASESQSIGKKKTSIISFNQVNKSILVNENILFAFVVTLKRELKLKSAGLPKWLEDESIKGFFREVKHCTTKPEAIKSILKGRKKSLPLVKNQDDAIKLVKSKGDVDIQKIIDICKQNNPLEKKSRYHDVEYIKDLASDIYEISIHQLSKRKNINSDQESELIKKYRITRKKTLKYVLYWSLMSGIQTYHGREIQVCTKKEKAYFGHCYKAFRTALEGLRKIKCTDQTFCPGIRSRTFKTELFKPKALKLKEENILQVTQFEDFMLHSKKDDLKPFQLQFLKERFTAIYDTMQYKKELKKAAYMKYKSWQLKKVAKSFDEDHPSNLEANRIMHHYEQKMWRLAKMSTTEPRFIKKYSEPSAYDFNVVNGAKPAPEYSFVGRKLIKVS